MEENINMDYVVVKSKTNNGFGGNNTFITENWGDREDSPKRY